MANVIVPETKEARLSKAGGHDLRIRILKRLLDGVASPNEMSKGFGESLPLVSYHVRILDALGCIELVKTTPRRGAIEHHYQLTSDGREITLVWGGASTADKCQQAATLLQEAQREMLRMGMKGWVSENGVNPIEETKPATLNAIRAGIAVEEFLVRQLEKARAA
jgi:DNA-binding transcriptional ArsR family regulator